MKLFNLHGLPGKAEWKKKSCWLRSLVGTKTHITFKTTYAGDRLQVFPVGKLPDQSGNTILKQPCWKSLDLNDQLKLSLITSMCVFSTFQLSGNSGLNHFEIETGSNWCKHKNAVYSIEINIKEGWHQWLCTFTFLQDLHRVTNLQRQAMLHRSSKTDQHCSTKKPSWSIT